MKRGAMMPRIGCFAALIVSIGCASDDVTAPAVEPAGRGALLVSDVVDEGQPTQLPAVRLTQTYVALPAGTVPGGVSATVTNLSTGVERSAAMVEGGLDPVSLPATEDDEIVLVAVDVSGTRHEMRAKVPPRRPPVVVRVAPARGRTDVPLNMIIVVVFSEPMDSSAVATGLILSRSGTVVPSTVTLTSERTRAELVPHGLLAAGESYQLGLSSDAADLSGDSLGEVLDVSFTTVPAVSGLRIEPLTRDTLPAGSIFTMTAYAYGSDGEPLGQQPVAWSVIEGPATLAGPRGRRASVQSVGVGQVSIEARVDEVADTATFTFEPLEIVDIDAGDSHTCGLLRHGGLVCWGNNEFSQIPALGEVSGATSPLPVHAPFATPHSALAVGGTSTCGGWGGSVKCWGRLGRLGLRGGGSSWPLQPDRLSVGGNVGHACGIAEGALLCWGMWHLQPNDYYSVDGPVPVDGGASYERVASGAAFFCGIVGGRVRCAGHNEMGQLGIGQYGYMKFFYSSPDPSGAAIVSYPIASANEFVEVVAGTDHACAVEPAGTVWCWGSNAFGALGAIEPAECRAPPAEDGCPASAVPVRSPLGFAALELAAGRDFTCALDGGGQAHCWGRNEWGQLGSGLVGDSGGPAPVADVGEGGIRKIVAGAHHACGLYRSGKVGCWGRNDAGQLGTGDFIPSTVPRLVQLQSAE